MGGEKQKVYRIYDSGPSIINYVAKKDVLEKLEKLEIITIQTYSQKELDEMGYDVMWIGPGNKTISKLIPDINSKHTSSRKKRYLSEKDWLFLCHHYFYEWKGKNILFQFKSFQRNMLSSINSKGVRSTWVRDTSLEYMLDRNQFIENESFIIIDFKKYQKIFQALSTQGAKDWFIPNYTKTVNYENQENVKFVQDELIKFGSISKIPSYPVDSWINEKWWIFRGWPLGYAKQMIIEHQSKASKSRTNIPNVYDKTYQMEKFGLDEIEAEEKIAKLKKNSSCFLENFIKKYGKEEGIARYNHKRDYWEKTMSLKSPEEKLEILKKKTENLYFCSKISQEMFDGIYKQIKDLGLKCYYQKLNHEYGAWCQTLKTGVLFDFVIPELKFVIEYNGSRFHPNKEKLSEKEWHEWIHPYSKKNADEVFEHDFLKNQSMITKGFEIMIVWDYEYLNNKTQKIEEIVKYIKNRFYEIKSC